jgi:hypothetical protein
MRLQQCLTLTLTLLLTLVLGGSGCGARPLTVAPGGVDLKPGHYLSAFYRAPEFAPEGVSFALMPFSVEQAQGVAPEVFQALLQRELTQAWQANGLKSAPPGESAAVLTGTVQAVKVRGRYFRWLTGKIAADLRVSGTIRRGEQVLFAFRDQVRVVSPINPGPPPPKETELLLQQAMRTFVSHLLNELLIHGFTADDG